MLGRKAKAGRYAERRYRRGLRSWRLKNRKLLAATLGPVVLAGLVVVGFDRDLVSWSAGLAVGAAVSLWTVLRETPPRYVETWREGAEGERLTEKELRPLERSGWRFVHDIQNGHGNYDHIAVGPSGVYLIESKNLQGIVKIKGGVPHLMRRHDPEKREVFGHVPRRALSDAAQLKEEFEDRTRHRTWVQAVVVFWGEFPEGFVQVGHCVFIEGSRLRAWLQARPPTLSDTEVDEIGAGLDAIARDAAAANEAAPLAAGSL
ncbi:MAG TPA: nuclease-related domain-containing protein [Solirubrobacterales bacterium]|nr:nuclease-related domain-containing protein [Solirubrobacterales bacterium]